MKMNIEPVKNQPGYDRKLYIPIVNRTGSKLYIYLQIKFQSL